MILIEKIIFLRHVSLFAEMTMEELGRLAAIAEEAVYSAGAPIITEGEHGDIMYVLVDGEVRIHSGGRDLVTYQRSQYFGELSIIDGEPRSASASALTDCLVLKIGKEEFHRILANNAAIAKAVLIAMTQDLRRARASQTDS